jgi:hypothetical protein
MSEIKCKGEIEAHLAAICSPISEYFDFFITPFWSLCLKIGVLTQTILAF